MNKLMNNTLALVAGLVLVTAVEAGPRGSNRGGNKGGNGTPRGGIKFGNFKKTPIKIGGGYQGKTNQPRTGLPKTGFPKNKTQPRTGFPTTRFPKKKVEVNKRTTTKGTTGQKLFKLNPTVKFTNYHTRYGVKRNYGFCYRGQNHHHWTYKCWVPTYGCHVYWDPCLRCYYYWCTPDNCWYPVTHCPYGQYHW